MAETVALNQVEQLFGEVLGVVSGTLERLHKPHRASLHCVRYEPTAFQCFAWRLPYRGLGRGERFTITTLDALPATAPLPMYTASTLCWPALSCVE